MRILVVEDNLRLLSLIGDHLTSAGYLVDTVRTATEFRDVAAGFRHELYLVDLGLPDNTGLTLIQDIRKRSPNTLILVATGCAKVGDRVAALNAGADDYLIKPFHVDELLARVRALLRRAHVPMQDELRAGQLVYNCGTNEVFCSGERVALRPSEQRLLGLLMRRSGHLVAKEAIQSVLERLGKENSPNALEKVVSRLRRSLAEQPAGIRLTTVKGVGYMLEEHGRERRQA
jgi:two-component system, OmpR family, response regulator